MFVVLATRLQARLNPLLRQLVISFLHLRQIAINLLLKASKAHFVRLLLIFPEEPNRVRQWVILVLGPVLGISHVLDPLAQGGQMP